MGVLIFFALFKRKKPNTSSSSLFFFAKASSSSLEPGSLYFRNASGHSGCRVCVWLIRGNNVWQRTFITHHKTPLFSPISFSSRIPKKDIHKRHPHSYTTLVEGQSYANYGENGAKTKESFVTNTPFLSQCALTHAVFKCWDQIHQGDGSRAGSSPLQY